MPMQKREHAHGPSGISEAPLSVFPGRRRADADPRRAPAALAPARHCQGRRRGHPAPGPGATCAGVPPRATGGNGGRRSPRRRLAGRSGSAGPSRPAAELCSRWPAPVQSGAAGRVGHRRASSPDGHPPCSRGSSRARSAAGEVAPAACRDRRPRLPGSSAARDHLPLAQAARDAEGDHALMVRGHDETRVHRRSSGWRGPSVHGTGRPTPRACLRVSLDCDTRGEVSAPRSG